MPLRRHSTILRALLATCALLLGAAALAEEENPAILVHPGERTAHRVAVQRFAESRLPADPELPTVVELPERATRFRAALQDGLVFTRSIQTLPDAAFLPPLQTGKLAGASRHDCPDWRQGGADALVEGDLRDEGARVVVEVAVWDVARCLRLFRATYARPPTYLDELARLPADSSSQRS